MGIAPVVTFDIETHSADQLYTMEPEQFVRIMGYKTSDHPDVFFTTDLAEMRRILRGARMLIGHNITAFDLPAIFGVYSDIPMQLADRRRVFDTWTHAVLVNPAPFEYVNRNGQKALGDTPEKMAKWFSLDEQAHQLGVPGKTADLAELALEFGDPDLPKHLRIIDGYGKIPLDDPRFLGYLRGDVLAAEQVARRLLQKGPLDEYAWREQRIAARAAVISANGFRIDVEAAEQRISDLEVRKEYILAELEEKYGLPTDGAAPWDTDAGKTAIMAALADYGITPKTHPDWPKTPVWDKKKEYLAKSKQKIAKLTEDIIGWNKELVDNPDMAERSKNARKNWINKASDEIMRLRKQPLPVHFGLSFGGKELIELTKGTEAEELGQALAELKGQRSLAQLALDSMHPDGFAHPRITMLQRSGRWSTTKPGLTVWTARGPGAIEKSYFLPDSDGEVLIEIDYSNADARAVAAMSGDTSYAERFEPGADGHMINAIAAWGEATVSKDPKKYRQMAKPLGHGWNYGGRANKLSKQTGVPLEEAKNFVNGMDRTYHRLVSWQNHVRKEAQRGYVTNPWGRKMYVDKGREYTQAPALQGQSATREIVCDALLKFPWEVLRMVKAQIHDALVFSVPKKDVDKAIAYLTREMYAVMNPRNGQRIEFPVEAGPPGANWYEASH
jgi:hypothetical protein